MTLRQAFKSWAMAPRNMTLAKNSRDAVEKVLMKKYAYVHLEQFTLGFVMRLFSLCQEPKEVKVKAASILVYVLSWGGDHGYCKRPNFDYTIANHVNDADKEGEEPSEPLVKVKLEALEKRKAVLAERDNASLGEMPRIMDNFDPSKREQPKEKEDMTEKKNKRGRNCRPCVQIDAETLKPIKTWDSISEAERELGAKNIDRAIARKGMAKGFYWCAVGYENDFKPNKASMGQSVAQGKRKEQKANTEPKKPLISDNMKPVGITPDLQTVVLQEKIDITKYSDEEILAEIRRRGWKGKLAITLNVEL